MSHHTEVAAVSSVLDSNSDIHDPDIKSKEFIDQKNKSKYIKENISVNRIQNYRKRSTEEFLNTDERRNAADIIIKRARDYKIAFDTVENECSRDPTLVGSIAQVMHASQAITDGSECKIETLLPSAFIAAENLLLMEEAMRNLTDCGVPGLIPLELSRRVLDADIEDSKEIVVTADCDR
mmetsp:Transcript_8430/g.12561  ORF Transcript_8430/g.12561 Transcript_8430/m.12561 type:complete len:180 (-) Transcript_8430:142-681(-)